MSAFIFALGMTLMHFLWQGLLLGCVTAAALTLLRNSRAEYRYLIACSALLACLCWPLFDLVQRLTMDTESANASLRNFEWIAATIGDEETWFTLLNSLRGIVGVWALCAAILALRMIAGLLWIDRTSRQPSNCQRHEQLHWEAELARLAERFGIRREVRLRVVDTLASPVTAGWWRPIVLVPATLVSGMPAELLYALLAHEMAHIKRHDYLINLLQNVIETLLFYHPAVWWISNRIRIERELIADDVAARQLGEPRRLAIALSELEKHHFSPHQLAQAANGGNLIMRIQHLLRPAPQALNWKAAIAMIGVAIACLSIYAEATAADKNVSNKTTALVNFSTCAKPRWPQAALKESRTGTVQLGFLVDRHGKVKNSRIDKSSGHSDLDEASRIGIEKCTFKPATRAGKPVESWTHLQYVWILE
ncbi:D-alanyl-D-alanine endopeptidase (penicillin-binding protein 7) [Duganella sacchari]|uniref:D-alanyl-D-alanine endopeptidase (Penicillin-binding protein 7) n=1 Tax=Duganella sacchari TaxID=551987 RepID=A0A1M7RA86_9BURK|nr:M56 family metallopeptidase [Duganella sacchari]SHN42958.1 D-alanyl-D-alanine endopeptidase (penicillin-binding protein 7) [Duganella sacchari]